MKGIINKTDKCDTMIRSGCALNIGKVGQRGKSGQQVQQQMLRYLPLETGNVCNWKQLLWSDTPRVFGSIFCLKGCGSEALEVGGSNNWVLNHGAIGHASGQVLGPTRKCLQLIGQHLIIGLELPYIPNMPPTSNTLVKLSNPCLWV